MEACFCLQLKFSFVLQMIFMDFILFVFLLLFLHCFHPSWGKTDPFTQAREYIVVGSHYSWLPDSSSQTTSRKASCQCVIQPFIESGRPEQSFLFGLITFLLGTEFNLYSLKQSVVLHLSKMISEKIQLSEYHSITCSLKNLKRNL